MQALQKDSTAIWAITPNGAAIARQIAGHLPVADIYMSRKIEPAARGTTVFDRLSETLEKKFHRYRAHIFIMATGIVVRVIAPFIQSKMEDPAVIVVDDRGRHVISLLAGHLGGANDLTRRVAEMIEALPVITTATDVNEKPAIDVLAKKNKLIIENPAAIKTVNMALLTDQRIDLHDPYGAIKDELPKAVMVTAADLAQPGAAATKGVHKDRVAAVFVDDQLLDLPDSVLVLRPATLVAGIGCNRNTSKKEIKDLLNKTLRKYQLAGASLDRIATIEIKSDEPGLIELAKALHVPIDFFSREKLNQAEGIQTPSAMVEKHIGVKSVCEAAAILASQGGDLIVPKQTTPNVTVAIARKTCLS